MSTPAKSRTVPWGTIDFFEKPYHHYTIDGVKIPSVTQALGVLDKSGPLVGWATKIDVGAALRLATEHWFRCVNHDCDHAWVPVPADGDCHYCFAPLEHYRLPRDGWKLQKDIRLAHIDHNYVLGDAQIRGTTIHKLHEDWVGEGKVPYPGDYPEAWRGYVKAYARWLMANFELDFESAEVLVGSRQHRYAGMCDTVAVTVDGGGERVRYDFKTSKGIYPSSHFPQLAGYELGAVECGDEPTDRQAIVRLGEDGTYEVAYSTATAADFLVLLAAFRSQKPFKDAERKAYNAKRRAKA